MDKNNLAKKRINQWLEGPYDEQTKNQIKFLMQKNPKELTDCFSQTLHFGTGGIRAKLGIGTNRLNIYTIAAAAQALCNYIIKQNEENPSVIIGFDNRKNSNLFAQICAKVIAANNIKAYLFKELRPTPLVSFGCRYKKCIAAIMITASHNPKDYNGYKVYWKDGGQVLPPHDISIIDEYNKIHSYSNVKILDSVDHPLIEIITTEIDTAYIDSVFAMDLFNKKIENTSLKIIYSNMHGTGLTLIPQCLKKLGFENITIVKEQESFDPEFTNAPNPNPEEMQALEIGINYLIKDNADIFISNDPDADRMGIVININGEKKILSGNEIASIMLDYLCKTSTLQIKSACVKSIVTTELLSKICLRYEIKCIDVLTGFKYICQKINEWDKNEAHKFLFGAEESLGFLIETFVRDKDAVTASLLIAKIADSAKKQNKTLLDLLHDIYSTYGIYREGNFSFAFEDSSKMKILMHNLRKNPLKTISNLTVSYIDDFQSQESINLTDNSKNKINLPPSNVLRFRLNDKSEITIRPSGTEPKLKIYAETSRLNIKNIQEDIKICDMHLNALIDAIKLQINNLLGI
ncbi:MAG: hypothetical protein ACD_7C00471G0002 [uncultured bacterium]|nr:MAG: hypothetical protein ACD_7C00471G0002 [uncultured bacterium]